MSEIGSTGTNASGTGPTLANQGQTPQEILVPNTRTNFALTPALAGQDILDYSTVFFTPS